MNRFWSTSAGVALRWVGYIPLGLALLLIVQMLCMVFFSWLFRDGRDFFVIGFLFGGFVVFPAAATLYVFLFQLIAIMCPRPKVGMIIFGTLFYVVGIANVFYGIATDSMPIKWIFMWIVCGAIAAYALREIWLESK